MKQDEVIRDLLSKAPPSTAFGSSLPDGFKAVSAEAAGQVDRGVVTGWVESQGGRVEHQGQAPHEPGEGVGRLADDAEPADLLWLVPEAALDL